MTLLDVAIAVVVVLAGGTLCVLIVECLVAGGRGEE